MQIYNGMGTRWFLVSALAVGCSGQVGGGQGDDSRDDGPGQEDDGSDGDGGSGGSGGSGPITPGDPGSIRPSAATFECDQKAKPPIDRLRKLTATQYRNTLADLAGFALGNPTTGSQVLGELTALAELPKDARASLPQDLHGSFRRLDQAVQQGQVDVFYQVGEQFGAALTKSDRLGKVVGACATDTNAGNDDSCLSEFIQRFGGRALRRPLTAEEVTFYRGIYASTGISAAGFADVIAALVGAPQFLYHVESGAMPVSGKTGLYTLSAYELASRLSYQLWDTTPDETLWKAAESGELLTESGYQTQVDRLLASPRARAPLEAFYAEWLKTEDVKALDALKDDARFKAFAGSDMPTSRLHTAMIEEVAALTRHYTWTAKGTVKDILTSDLSFAQSTELARIYGVPVWDGQGEPPRLQGERPGVLTRAAFLTSASGNTRPIMKGAFIRQTVLCDVIPPPPPNAGANPPLMSGDRTTRQVVEGLTEGDGTSCAGCHTTMINPLGFATEGYDALGRRRTVQKVFDDSGKLLRELPIDTRSVPRVAVDDERESSGAVDLMSMMADSGKVEACLARQYFRFTFARWEDEVVDGCTLERVRKVARDGTLADMLREIVMVPQFKQRRFD